MVRLNDIINEEGESEKAPPSHLEMIEQIEKFFEGDFFLMPESTPNLVHVRVTGLLKLKSEIKGKIPLKIHKVFGSYSCAGRGLDSLENAPDVVIGRFDCSGNYLNTLEYLPKKLNNGVICYNNPLVSLKGIDTDSRINGAVKLTYTDALPLLRLMMLTNQAEVSFYEKEWWHQDGCEDLENIINIHIRSEPELKQRMYNCQYALIKAGYKANARW